MLNLQDQFRAFLQQFRTIYSQEASKRKITKDWFYIILPLITVDLQTKCSHLSDIKLADGGFLIVDIRITRDNLQGTFRLDRKNKLDNWDKFIGLMLRFHVLCRCTYLLGSNCIIIKENNNVTIVEATARRTIFHVHSQETASTIFSVKGRPILYQLSTVITTSVQLVEELWLETL